MDEQTEKKIRDLKLKIHKTEKELQSSQHHMKLGAWLRAGHAGQINRNAEKDRLRLEEKLKELKLMLESLTGSLSSTDIKFTPPEEVSSADKNETPMAKPKKAAPKITEPPIEKPVKKNTATSKEATAKKNPANKPVKK